MPPTGQDCPLGVLHVITDSVVCDLLNVTVDCPRFQSVNMMDGLKSFPSLLKTNQSLKEKIWLTRPLCWGGFGAGTVGDLHKVKGILNKESYYSILQWQSISCGQCLGPILSYNRAMTQNIVPNYVKPTQE